MAVSSKESSSPLWQDGSDVMIRAIIHPGAKRDGIVGEHDRSLKIDIKAAPEHGEANESLIRFFAKLFLKSRSEVEVRYGHVSRKKLLAIHNCLCSDLLSIVQQHTRSSINP